MTAAGLTLGVEEEFHLVRPVSGALAAEPDVIATAQQRLGDAVTREISTSQVEIVTPVCTSLAEVRAQLTRLRAGVVEAAAEHGAEVLAGGTHPFASWRDQELTAGAGYDTLVQRWGLLALQQLITGQHVHVGVPDDLAVPVLDRIGPDLPTLMALSSASPFWEGVDTGYASYRTQWFSRWPITGTLPVLRDRDAYDAFVARLVDAGAAETASRLYWDARPAVRYPTVEVRVADTSPRLDDAVLHAGLCRALVRRAARLVDDVVEAPTELVRVARWRAAKGGMSGDLLDVRTGQLVAAPVAVKELLGRVRDDLEELEDWDEVSALTDAVLQGGTSADRQRAAAARGGLPAVVASVVAELEGSPGA